MTAMFGRANKVSRLLIAALITLPIIGQPTQKAWPEEPDGFKGVKFGSSVAEARSVLEFSQCFRADEQKPTTCPLTVDTGEFEMNVFLLFVDDKLVTVVGGFPSKNYSGARGIFVEKYGAPHESLKDVVQNGMGAKFDREQLTWVGKNSRVSLSQYGEKISEGVFMVSLANPPDPAKQIRDAQKKKALN